MTKVFKNFEADTGKILNIVINSLYSDREIFLRELLSNALMRYKSGVTLGKQIRPF